MLLGGKNHYVSLLPSKGLVGEIDGEVAVRLHICNELLAKCPRVELFEVCVYKTCHSRGE